MSALFEISVLATRADDAAAALPPALQIIVADLKAASGAIALVNPDTGQLEAEARIGLPFGEELALAPGQGLPGWAVLHSKPVLAADTRADTRYRALRHGVRSQVAAPLRSESGLAIGVIFLDRDEAGSFTEADLTRLTALADETARVLHRLWEIAHLRNKARQLETLLTAGPSLVTKLEEQELFDALTRDARQLMQARAAALYLYNPSAETVRVAALTSSAVTPPPAGDLPASSCLVASALHTRKAVAFLDVQSPDNHDLLDLPRDPRLRSMLVTPLLYEGEPLGALAVFLDRVHRFDNDEKRLCATLAGLGAVALQNVRLYARVFLSEASLRKNERLTTLGLLAAEIAHEIRNPLTVLKLLHGSLGLEAELPEQDPRRRDLRVIAEKLDQLEGIVSRVLNIGRAPESLHTRVSLGEIVDDALVLMRLKLAQSKIFVHFTPPNPPLVVDAHKGQLHQALLNLLFNAMQAMPEGGEITLTLSAMPYGGHLAAVLDIADTGPGIPEMIRSRIFDSFLSGRPGGTGLGLAIVKRVVQSHHGEVELLASSAAGTTFRIYLPLAKG